LSLFQDTTIFFMSQFCYNSGMNAEVKLISLPLVLLSFLVLSFCSTKGRDHWNILTEPEQPKEEQKETEQPADKTVVTEKFKGVKKIEEVKEVDTAEITPGGIFQTGIASWYGDGDDFHGKRTANGEIYDMNKLTAAHQTLPFHTLVEVENMENGKKVTVRINDRGPFIDGRIIDLSRKAAKQIGIYAPGTAPVRLRITKTPGDMKIVQPAQTPGGTGAEPEQPTAPTPDSLPDTVTEPDTTPPVTAAGQPQDNQGKYYLQAGAFSSMKNARRLLEKINETLPGLPFKITFQDGLYKVLSDWLDSREAAEVLKNRLKALGIDSFIREE